MWLPCLAAARLAALLMRAPVVRGSPKAGAAQGSPRIALRFCGRLPSLCRTILQACWPIGNVHRFPFRSFSRQVPPMATWAAPFNGPMGDLAVRVTNNRRSTIGYNKPISSAVALLHRWGRHTHNGKGRGEGEVVPERKRTRRAIRQAAHTLAHACHQCGAERTVPLDGTVQWRQAWKMVKLSGAQSTSSCRKRGAWCASP